MAAQTWTVARIYQNVQLPRPVYFEEYGWIVQAIAREKQIKGWTRAKKDALIAMMNPEWKDLAAEWHEDP